MAHELTWQHQYGAAGEGLRLGAPSSVADGRARVLWNMARFLTGADGKATSGLWTVFGSGNAVGSGAFDGADRWSLTGSFDTTKIRYADAFNYSWICLKAPASLHDSLYLLVGCVAAANGIQAFLSFEQPRAAHGASWGSASIPTSISISAVVRNGNTVILSPMNAGGSAIYVSSDGGTTWATRTAPAQGVVIQSGGMRGSTAIFVGWSSAGSPGAMLRSADSGATWSYIGLGASTFYHAIAFGDGTEVTAVGNGITATSDDDGATWTPRANIGALLMRSVIASGNVRVAVGDGGFCCRSTDKGVTWTQIAIPGGGNFWSLTADGNSLCAVGTNCCATSDDLGATWTARAIPPGGYTASSRNGSSISAMGSAGVLSVSYDAGATWLARTAPTTLSISGMAADGDEVIAVSGGYSTLVFRASSGWASQSYLSLKQSGAATPYVAHAVTLHSQTMHGWLSTRGDAYLAFGRVGDGRHALGIYLARMQDGPGGDPYPVLLGFTGDSTQAAIGIATEAFGQHGGMAMNAATGRGLSAQYGAVLATIPAPYYYTPNVGVTTLSEPGPTPALALPAVVSAAAAFGSSGMTSPAWRGRLPDAKTGKSYPLDLAPSVGAPEWINVGALWLPWPAGVTPQV